MASSQCRVPVCHTLADEALRVPATVLTLSLGLDKAYRTGHERAKDTGPRSPALTDPTPMSQNP